MAKMAKKSSQIRLAQCPAVCHSTYSRTYARIHENKLAKVRFFHSLDKLSIFSPTNKGTQITYINTTEEYQPTKYSVPVPIHTTARGTVYRELGAELKIDNKLLVSQVESFKQLLSEQPAWI